MRNYYPLINSMGSGAVISTLNTGLFAAYNADNNTNDSFGTNNGTAYGGLTYVTGKIGEAFNGNGSNSYIELPNNSLNFTGDFSVSTWVKMSAGTINCILGNYAVQSGNNGWVIALKNNNDIDFSIYNGATIVSLSYTNAATFTTQYNHIYVERKAGVGSKIYLNNVLVASNSSAVNPQYATTHYPAICGVIENPSTKYWYMNGAVDATTIWNRALTTNEITELYTGKQYPF
jgi:hypothetical protein